MQIKDMLSLQKRASLEADALIHDYERWLLEEGRRLDRLHKEAEGLMKEHILRAV